MSVVLFLLFALAASTAIFYLIDRYASRTARNWTLGIWVVLCFIGLLTLLVLISAHPSSEDELAKVLAVTASAAFLVLGVSGAGLAWVARRIWG